MNPKVVNLIAAQLGILIGMASWLVYSRFPAAERSVAAGIQEGTADFATATSALEPGDQRPYAVNYSAAGEQVEPVDAEPALTLQQKYDREISGQLYARSGVANSSVAVNSPTYAEVAPEPATVQSDYEAPPPTVEYAQPIQTIYYAQPTQIIVFSNPRPFANRCRSTPHFGGELTPITRRCPGGREPEAQVPSPIIPPPVNPRINPPPHPEGGVIPRRTAHMPSYPRAHQAGPSLGRQHN